MDGGAGRRGRGALSACACACVKYRARRKEWLVLCPIINPRRACAARVTVVVRVCLLSHISPMERLFVLKTLSRTQRVTKVKYFVGVFLKPLRCRDPVLPPLYGHAYVHSAIVPAESTHAHYSMGLAAPPSVYIESLASLPLPRLAAQRNGGKRMCQSGLPADAASLRETGIVDRYTPPVGPCPIE